MYPWYNDPLFVSKILSKKEFYDNRNEDKSCLKYYQRLAANYINPKSPYNSLLLYMNVGTGKTLASIAIAENFIKHTNMKIMVITKNEDLVRNYITELLVVCSNYTTPSEIEEFRKSKPSEKINLLKNWYPRINAYSFRHHEEFKKSYNKGEIKNLSNRVIIIDEVHKIIGNTGYDILLDLLSKSVNYRLILLSATPVFDNILDIFQLSNLFQIKQKKNLLSTDEITLLRQNYIKRMVDIENISIFKDEKSIFSLTSEGLSKIKNLMNGHVIYVKSSPDNFPRIIEMGEKISIGDYTTDVPLITCKMHPYQEERYKKWFEVLKSSKDFNRNLEHASNMVYPDYQGQLYIGNAGYNLYAADMSIFKESEIEKYSSKLYNLLKNIKKSSGKVCIYSSYINDDGIAIIEKLLRANGFKSYISLTGKIQAQTRKLQIERYNNEQNDDGSDIKILLFSSVLAEGITLKSVKEMHIFEPAWNMSSLDQIIGRIYRTDSHARLPPNERNIKIFRYCAVPSDYKISNDLSKYIKAGRKDYFIKKLERELIKGSFLCSYTKQTNLKFSGQYKDGDRECEYQECNYTCDTEPNITTIDDSTYDTAFHSSYLHENIKKKAVKIFEKDKYMSVDNMVKITDVQRIELIKSMRTLIRNKTLKLQVKDNYYIKKQDIPKEQVVVEKLQTQKIRMDKEKIYIGNSKGKICSSYKKDEIIDFFKLAGLPQPNKKLTKDLLCKQLYQELTNQK
jgi:superfamily II DNA or RNA helicase